MIRIRQVYNPTTQLLGKAVRISASLQQSSLFHNILKTDLKMAPVHKPVSETKHLSTGSTHPPETPGLLRLYSMRFCPYAQRARLVLAAKKIPNEVVNVNLVAKPDWLFVRNPLGKVPCIELDGKVLFESLIVCDYLDEVYKQRLLNPADPFQKAQDRILVELFNKVSGNMYKIYRAFSSPDEAKKLFDELLESLETFEKEISKRGTDFYGGDLPGMLDYMIWPWMERLPAIAVLAGDSMKVPEVRFPLLTGWFKRMSEDPAVQESYFTPEVHAKFITSFLGGKPDYDMEV